MTRMNRLRWVLAGIGAATLAFVGLDLELDRREAARRRGLVKA